MMKTYKISYSGNATRFKGIAETVECKRGSFEVCCRENGDIIEDGLNKDEAIELIERYEAMDRREGSYSPDFYEARRSK